MPPNFPPVLGFAARSGTGKTTLLKRLIPLLSGQGLRVGLIKHAHHDVEPDVAGKDSYELRKAGACQVLLASHRRWALYTELDEPREPNLFEALERMDCSTLDLILVEGFRQAPIPKIELHRAELGREPFFPVDPHVVAVATDRSVSVATDLPLLDINHPEAVAAWVLRWVGDRPRA
jgi:molybdopterin-guanine dinucleotide biosynthesis protein B